MENLTQKPEDLPQEKQRPEGKKAGLFGSLWFFVWDFLKVFLIALAIIIPVRFYLFQPFIVTGQSMEPTFEDGEYLIIDEISYRLAPPNRGDVVVVKSPQYPAQYLIKRIVGLPGETLQIEGGKIVVKNDAYPEGLTLQEQYLSDNVVTFGNINVKLQSDRYYVLGDNRIASSDSRVFGPINKKDIVGRVIIRAFPPSRLDVFGSPNYRM